MTVVVAIKDGDVIIMASDSSCTRGDNEMSIREGNSKVWEVYIENLGSVLIGFGGNFATCQSLRYSYIFPSMDKKYTTIQAYLSSCVQPSIMKFLQDRFLSAKHQESILSYHKENTYEWALLFATKGQIFTLSPCGDVEETIENYAAIGDGAQCALSALSTLRVLSLYTNQVLTLRSDQKLEVACNAAEKWKNTVRGPFHYMSVGMV